MIVVVTSGDCEVLVLSIYFKISPVTEVEIKLQMDNFHKPHSEDQGKAESREMNHDVITDY